MDDKSALGALTHIGASAAQSFVKLWLLSSIKKSATLPKLSAGEREDLSK
jgi:hypothetical protein